jgi:hypothetical protein
MSAVFFLVFFTFGSADWHVSDTSRAASPKKVDSATRQALLTKYTNQLGKPATDSLDRRRIELLRDTGRPVYLSDLGIDTARRFLTFSGKNYNSLREYDSAQAILPAADRDGWFRKMMLHKGLQLDDKYRGRSDEGSNKLLEALLHRLPYMLFLSLPFFALILQMLYLRRKQFAYSDHAVFTLYHYVFTFLLLTATFLTDALLSQFHREIPSLVNTVLYLGWLAFLFISMRRFYRQGTAKTILKLILLNILGFLMILILFVIFIFFSLFQM